MPIGLYYSMYACLENAGYNRKLLDMSLQSRSIRDFNNYSARIAGNFDVTPLSYLHISLYKIPSSHTYFSLITNIIVWVIPPDYWCVS